MIKLTALNKSRVFLFSILALLALYVFVVQEFLFLQHNTERLNRYRAMSVFLVPHAILGFIALVVGPFQFSTTLRKKNLALHRRLGKIYIIAILLAFPFAVLININYPIPGAKITFVMENMIQASVWAFTAAMAWVAAAKRQITLHKMWVARSYGITLVFVLSRIYNPMQFFINKPDINDFTHFLWLLVVLALIIPDILVFNKELFTARKKG